MNLPLSLTLNDLKSLFPQSTSVTIMMKPYEEADSQLSLLNPVNPTAMVKFHSQGEAEEAMEDYQGVRIRGNALKISVELPPGPQ